MSVTILDPTQWNSSLSEDNYALLVGGQDYWVENAQAPYSLTAPNSQTLRFEVQPGDTWVYDPTTKNRSEIEAWTHYNTDTQINVSYGFQLEPGAANNADWFVIGQFHDNSTTNSPPMSIQMFGERMAVVIRQDTPSGQVETQLWKDSQDIVRGHTYNIQIHVVFDAQNNGHLVVVRDGVTLVDYSGSIGYGSTSSVYWKEGIYRAADSTTQAADYSNLQITTGDVATAPATTTNTATTPTTTTTTTPTTTTTTTTSPTTTSPTTTTTTTAPSATAPHTPVVSAISPDTGASSTDGVTNANKLLVSGAADANSTVTVYLDGASIGTATADSAGAWVYDASGRTLADGGHAFTATAANAAGVSAPSSAFHVTVDTVAPTLSVSTVSQSSSTDTLKGWSDGGVVTVSENGHVLATSSVASTGAWAASFAASQNVMHTFLVTDTDDAGNATSMHVIVGTAKADTLTALGNGDFLVGDGGNNTYVLNANITGTKLDAFRVGHDKIDFKGFDSATAHVTQIDSTHWQVADHLHTDTFVVGNGVSLHSSDYFFG